MKLSIITITFNDLKGLQKTFNSVCEQSFTDFEWIVVDGGSNDGTKEFLEANNASITCWSSEQDTGRYNAMNKGIRKAHGERLLFMNSGDTFVAADSLEKVYATSMTADVVYGDAYYNRTEGLRYEHYPEILTLEHFMYHSICHQASFIRREILSEKGYDESLVIVADWKRAMEMFLEGRTFQHLPFAVAIYDVTGISTTNLELCDAERDKVLTALFSPRVREALLRAADCLPQCEQVRYYMSRSKLYKRIIRSTLHFIRWMDGV